MEYRYVNVRINSVSDASIWCENFMKFGPVTQELTKVICERLVRHGQRTGAFCQISPDLQDRISQSLHHMRALWVQMIILDLIFRFGKECCHGNQIMLP